MAAVHIRDLPDDVVDALKRRAATNDRSLQKELRHILCGVAREAPPAEVLPPLKLKLSTARTRRPWTREHIYGDDGR